MTVRRRTTLVTGASGNLGRKVIAALAGLPGCETIIGVDTIEPREPLPEPPGIRTRFVRGDLTRRQDGWLSALGEADTLVHLAAYSMPDATLADATASIDMTLNVVMAAARLGVGRVVFASSNHVMGGYKDPPLSAGIGPGTLTTAIAPAPGTRWHDGTRPIHSFHYGLSKLIGERVCAAAVDQFLGTLTSVAIRVGWAQPGDNRPETISHAGAPIDSRPDGAVDEQDRRSLRWFRDMWLSNGDLARLFVAAVSADASGWPSPAIVVNGTSDNSGMAWDLSASREWLGYRPRDDLYRHVGAG